jgi:hypothetical protein
MRAQFLVGLASVIFVFANTAAAQEIIVTGARMERYESLQIPNVFMTRRADNAIFSLVVRSDTRDLSQRTGELREALRGLQSRARNGAVSLALVDEDVGIVRDFTMAGAEELIRADRRPDTSMLTIRVRTPVGENDSLDDITQRIESFVENAPKPGRVEMETGDMELTLVSPQQYREPLLTQIVADGRRVSEMLGAGYGIRVDGLERQIAWQRSGELELTLFIPYALSAAPQP